MIYSFPKHMPAHIQPQPVPKQAPFQPPAHHPRLDGWKTSWVKSWNGCVDIPFYLCAPIVFSNWKMTFCFLQFINDPILSLASIPIISCLQTTVPLAVLQFSAFSTPTITVLHIFNAAARRCLYSQILQWLSFHSDKKWVSILTMGPLNCRAIYSPWPTLILFLGLFVSASGFCTCFFFPRMLCSQVPSSLLPSELHWTVTVSLMSLL